MERAIIKRFILAIILLSFAGNLILVFFNQGMWWDEAVYLGLGRALLHGSYTLQQSSALESFRPPAFPFVISPLSDSVLLARVAVIAISALSVLFMYHAAKKLFGKEPALWASLLLSTSYLFIFFSGKALSEPLFMSFLSVSLMFMAIWSQDKRPGSAFLAGAFVGFALITRYLGGLVVISYLLFFLVVLLQKRDRTTFMGLLAILAGFAIPIIPWMMLSMAYYGNPLGALAANSTVTFELPSWDFPGAGLDMLSVLSITLPFLAIGLASLTRKRYLNRNALLLLILSVMTLFAYVALPYREPRYLLSFFPVYAIVAGFGMHMITKSGRIKRFAVYVQFGAIAACVIIAALALQAVWADRVSSSCLVQSSLKIKELAQTNETVMSESYPYPIYILDRATIRPPRNETEFLPALRDNNISFLLVYRFEPKNPGYLENLPPGFVKIQAYGQWDDKEACVIYRYGD